MTSETLHVPLGKEAYDVIIGKNLLSDAAKWLAPVMPARRAILIADDSIAERYGAPIIASLKQAGMQCDCIPIGGGEASKSFEGYQALMSELLALKPDRKTTIIALGGGVIGDLAGFAACTLLRGVPFVQIPTTLLAQVDSSVGGKTGINSEFGKNLIGSFYQPRRVLIDIDTLQSLPRRELLAGYAEIVKYAVLGDAHFMQWLEANGEKLLALEWMPLMHAIKLCLSIKAELVEWDAKEQNMRALLNLGHTFGHALEAEAGYDGRLLHGEAVAIGLVMAAKLSALMELCPADAEARIAAHLKAVGLPASPAAISGVNWDINAICSHFAQDKKALGGALTFVLITSIGDAELVHGVPADMARIAVEQALTSG